MSGDRYNEAKRVFLAASAQPPTLRLDYVAEACGADSELRREVEGLLAATDSEPTIAHAHLVAQAAPEVAGYRLLGEISRGGMGVVYLAEREDGGFRQRVALKVLGVAGYRDPEAHARFRAERQILATLDHPNIARLFDGGTTADGSPFLAMEYVEGTRIDLWCEQHTQSPRAIVALLLKVCRAVQSAHRRLVVHRDLKPGNILVDAYGEPKLLDFGIAKLLGAGDIEVSRADTRTGQQPLTPRYAAPEQIRGEAVTTATDVYAMGVVLYELLTGRSPYGEAISRPHQLAQAICEQAPSLPSTGPARDTSPGGERARLLARGLRGDLDAVVLKCLRKRADERYGGMDALIADLEAYLAGAPVSARRGNRLYRTRVFVRRHWAALLTAAGVAALTVGFLVSTRQQLAATAIERDKAEHIATFLTDMFRIVDPGESRGNSITAREVLDRGAASLRQDRSLDPAVRGGLLVTMGQVYRQLGLVDVAEQTLREAVSGFADGPPLERAAAQNALASVLLDRGRYAEADALIAEIAASLPSDASADAARARLLYNQGESALRQGRLDAAVAPLEQSIAVRRRLFGEPSKEVAEALVALGSVRRDQGDLERAEPLYRNALAQIERDGADPWTRTKVLNNIAVVAGDRGDLEAAATGFAGVLTSMRALLGDEHVLVSAALGNLASVRGRQGHWSEALDLQQEALRIRRKVFGERHPATATALGNLGYNHFALGDVAAARTELETALAIHRETAGPAHPHTLNDLRNLVALHLTRNEVDAARAHNSTLIRDALTGNAGNHPFVAQAEVRAAFLDCMAGSTCNVEALGTASERLLKASGEKHPDVAGARLLQALVARATGDAAGACRNAELALPALAAQLSEDHWDRSAAQILVDQCHATRTDHRPALAALEQRYGASHFILQQLRSGEHPRT